MTKYLVHFLLFILLISCENSPNGNIQIQLANDNTKGNVFLEKIEPHSIVPCDTGVFFENKIHFDFKPTTLGIYQVRHNQSKFFLLLDSKSNLSIQVNNLDSLQLAEASDSLNKPFNVLNQLIAEQYFIEEDIRLEYQKAKDQHLESEVFKNLNNRYKLSQIKYKNKLKTFIQENSDDYSCLVALTYFNFNEEIELYKSTLKTLISTFGSDDKYLQIIQKEFEEATYLLDTKVDDIHLNDINDSPKSLYSLKDSLILLEFWASWSSPYIQGIHEHKRILSKYLDNGIKVYSINMDTDLELWKNTVQRLNLKWIHVNDPKGLELSEFKSLFHLNRLPSNLLLNSNYTVIDKNLFGQHLEDKILELLAY